MKDVAEKIAGLLPQLEKRGPVFLFEREDLVGKWDLVFSSQWSDGNSAPAVHIISKELGPRLKGDEVTALSRIVVIPSKEPSVAALAAGMSVTGGCVELVSCNFMGLQIKHAFVFKSQRPPVPQKAPAPA